jgi:cholest-4-en-3-one 26-monooxygenase
VVAERTEELQQRSREALATVKQGGFEPKGSHPLRPEVNLLDGAWYATDPHADWTWLRAHAPAYYDPNSDVWALSRYDDVLFASRNPELFSNHDNIRPKTGHVPMMISMDDPEHNQRRKLVNKGFTRRRVRDQEPRLRAICDPLLDKMIAQEGECDFVWTVAAWLPLIAIADMLGVAPEDREALLRWSDLLLRGTEGDLDALEEATQAFGEYWAYQANVIADRKVNPRDDLISVLTQAEVDGDRLDDESLIWESLLILIGGDETTRHVLSGGLAALLQHPDQLAALREDYAARIPTAVEEMVRWVSPIKSMSRKLTEDVTIGGETIPQGDEVLLLYPSANRDDSQFADPFRFDLRRDPNNHLAFGHGTHFCLGANLARLEITLLFERLLDRIGHLELAVAPQELRIRSSSFTTGFEHLPIRFEPR